MFSGILIFLPMLLGVNAVVEGRTPLKLMNSHYWNGNGPVFPRQTGAPQVPAECQTDCGPVIPQVAQGCQQFSECCQATFIMSYYNCFLCVGRVSGIQDYSEAQSLLDGLVRTCMAQGFMNVPTQLTFPSGPLSTTSRSTSTVSRSVPVTSATSTSSVRSTVPITSSLTSSLTPTLTSTSPSDTLPTNPAGQTDTSSAFLRYSPPYASLELIIFSIVLLVSTCFLLM